MTKNPETYITDVNLAHDMALAEDPHRTKVISLKNELLEAKMGISNKDVGVIKGSIDNEVNEAKKSALRAEEYYKLRDGKDNHGFTIPINLLYGIEDYSDNPKEDREELIKTYEILGDLADATLKIFDSIDVTWQHKPVDPDAQFAAITIQDGEIKNLEEVDPESAQLLPRIFVETNTQGDSYRVAYSNPDSNEIILRYKNRPGSSPDNGWTLSKREIYPDGSVKIQTTSKITHDDMKMAWDTLAIFDRIIRDEKQ